MSGAGPPGGDRRPPRTLRRRPPVDRGRFRPTRLQLVAGLALALGAVQILYEDVVLFLATTTGGVSGLLSTRLVAIGVPLTIAAVLIVLLVGGALVAEDRRRRGSRPERRARDPEEGPPDTGERPARDAGRRAPDSGERQAQDSGGRATDPDGSVESDEDPPDDDERAGGAGSRGPDD